MVLREDLWDFNQVWVRRGRSLSWTKLNEGRNSLSAWFTDKKLGARREAAICLWKGFYPMLKILDFSVASMELVKRFKSSEARSSPLSEVTEQIVLWREIYKPVTAHSHTHHHHSIPWLIVPTMQVSSNTCMVDRILSVAIERATTLPWTKAVTKHEGCGTRVHPKLLTTCKNCSIERKFLPDDYSFWERFVYRPLFTEPTGCSFHSLFHALVFTGNSCRRVHCATLGCPQPGTRLQTPAWAFLLRGK